MRVKRDARAVDRFRDSHHRLAWLVASGMRLEVVAESSGYSMSRLYTLNTDPAFKELVAKKRELVDENRAEVMDDFERLIKGNMLKAERMISDKLDDADKAEELLPTRELIAISRDAADRLGYGKKQTQVNVNIDFAAKLDRAMSRSAKVIEHEPPRLSPPRPGSDAPTSTSRALGSTLTAASLVSAPPLSRRRVA